MPTPAGLNYYALEVVDVVFVTIYYLVFGFTASLLINRVIEIFDEDAGKYEKFSTLRLGIEITVHGIVLAVVFYFLRNFIRLIPFPWDGIRNYDHSSLYEIDGGIVLVIVILFFQRQLIEKVGIFQNRSAGTDYHFKSEFFELNTAFDNGLYMSANSPTNENAIVTVLYVSSN